MPFIWRQALYLNRPIADIAPALSLQRTIVKAYVIAIISPRRCQLVYGQCPWPIAHPLLCWTLAVQMTDHMATRSPRLSLSHDHDIRHNERTAAISHFMLQMSSSVRSNPTVRDSNRFIYSFKLHKSNNVTSL